MHTRNQAPETECKETHKDAHTSTELTCACLCVHTRIANQRSGHAQDYWNARQKAWQRLILCLYREKLASTIEDVTVLKLYAPNNIALKCVKQTDLRCHYASMFLPTEDPPGVLRAPAGPPASLITTSVVSVCKYLFTCPSPTTVTRS